MERISKVKVLGLLAVFVLFATLFSGIAEAQLADAIKTRFTNFASAYSTLPGGDLNPAYSTERLIMDYIIYGLLFLGLITFSVFKTMKDAPQGAKVAIIVSISTIFTILMARVFSIGNLVPYAMYIGFFILAFIAYLVISTFIGKDKPWKKVVSVLLAILVAFAAVNAFNLLDVKAKGLNIFGPLFNTEKSIQDQTANIAQLQSKIAANPNDAAAKKDLANAHFQQGNKDIQDLKYDSAKNNFLATLELINYNPRDPLFDKTLRALTSDIWAARSVEDLAVIKAKLESAYVVREAALRIGESNPQSDPLKKQSQALFGEAETIGAALLKEAARQEERIQEAEDIKKSIEAQLPK